ncbi:hypothetical protein AA23498_3432 [Acetobacter nitrogenifigens DSM 23921 = NBRC 105050]|uniref:hypothetical protein n=1 Tax=Acetobacter nitrogenifigens TaxID=285268 RepID=UPI00040E5537|nr:hypothetical protein [Acetobacter nitrogenifigens]GBQ99188.1 hypothetical protein AA23498_3432 [Acetobacter nitrogenifigens DSM 23921 = NBRC 105050]
MPIPSIKTATKEAVKRCGGLDAAACVVRVGKSNLSDYGNRDRPHIVPVDVAVMLDLCAQAPLILSAMAHAEGYMLVPTQFGEGHLPRDMQRFTEETSDAIRKGFEILEDGVVDVHEAQAMLAHMQRVKSVAEHIAAGMTKIIVGTRPHIVAASA